MPITRRHFAAAVPLAAVSSVLRAGSARADSTQAFVVEDSLSWLRSAGQTWLVGELLVQSGAGRTDELQSVVMSGSDGATLLRLDGERLLAAATDAKDAKGRPATALSLAVGDALRVFVWHALPAFAAPPLAVRVDCLMRSSPDPMSITLAAAAPVTLQAPLRGGPWVAVFDPGMPFGHRRAAFDREGHRYIPARFAIDWIRLDERGRPWTGEAGRPFERWHGWGQEVLAVADGEIVVVRDGRDDVMATDLPAAPWTDDDVSGNVVGLRLGDSRVAFYEHLQRGSITVRPGQGVKAGQVIGRIGRSGVNSSGPHLHFHVADSASTLYAQGRPFVFSSFRALGSYRSMADAESGQGWTPLPGRSGALVRDESPAPNGVLMFGDATTASGRTG